jgi:hypothetical protein
MRYFIVFLFIYSTAFSQHQHNNPDPSQESENKNVAADSVLTFPMQRQGSGTSWVPDSTESMHYTAMLGKWHLMTHFNVFLRYTSQNFNHSNKRGSDHFDIPGMVMMMAERKLSSRNTIKLSLMASPDIATIGGEGYPLLYQTGETFRGKPLLDRQHPHDLLGEASVKLTHRLRSGNNVFLYVGYPAEPALGPPAYFHRETGMYNPDAPLGHHWQDATHISFGVVTLGFQRKKYQLEVSSFNGIEPDEDRVKPDPFRLNSYSFRFSLNPNERTAIQLSSGSLKETLSGDQDSHHHNGHDADQGQEIRSTLSVIRVLPLVLHTSLRNSFVFGLNSENSRHSPSVLFESAFVMPNTTFYTRFEAVEKSKSLLQVNDEETPVTVVALTGGISRNLFCLFGTYISLGAQMTANYAKEVQGHYGKIPLSGQVSLRFYPSPFKPDRSSHEQHNHEMHSS